MKRFQFGLDKVRLWRHEQAEMEELKLQQLNAQVQQLIRQKLDLQTEARTAAQTLRERAAIDAADLCWLDTFKQHVHSRSLTLDAQKSQLGIKIGQQRQAVIEARRKGELLDRMKAVNLAEWRAAYDRDQEALSNELFLAKRKRIS